MNRAQGICFLSFDTWLHVHRTTFERNSFLGHHLLISLRAANVFPVVASLSPKIRSFSAGETRAEKTGCSRRLSPGLKWENKTHKLI